MKLNLTADEVLTTTRSVRKRLDFDKPVDRATVEECLEIATQAPTGSNSQGWHWVVIEDPELRKAVCAVYQRNFRQYALDARCGVPARRQPRRAPGAGPRLGDLPVGQLRQGADAADPVHLGPAHRRSPRRPAFWGSLLPAVWSFMLALRERGMGSAWTTIHLMNDGEREVAELLGIPYDKVSQGGLFPIAYTIGTDFKLAKREPLAKVLHWDRW